LLKINAFIGICCDSQVGLIGPIKWVLQSIYSWYLSWLVSRDLHPQLPNALSAWFVC